MVAPLVVVVMVGVMVEVVGARQDDGGLNFAELGEMANWCDDNDKHENLMILENLTAKLLVMIKSLYLI